MASNPAGYSFSTFSDRVKLARSVKNSGGVYVVPAFVGLGAPYWNPHARGSILGITRGTNPAHIARAALESIAFQCSDLISAFESDIGSRIELLRADGSGTTEKNSSRPERILSRGKMAR